MGRDCLFIVACNTDHDDLERIGLEPVGAPVTGADAADGSFDGVAVLRHGLHVVFVNPDRSLLTGGEVLSRLLGRDAVTALFGASSDSYLWRVDGPGHTRTWMSHGGETIDESGLAGPEEAGIGSLEERSLLSLLTLRTGFGADDSWLRESAQPVSWPPAGPQPKQKKRWFARE